MRFESVSQVFELLEGRFDPAAAEGLEAVFQFLIEGEGGGQWLVAIQDQACRVAAGVHAAPSLSLALSAEHWLKIVNGEMAAMPAYMTGKLKATGNIMLAAKLGKLFRLKL